MKKIIIAIFVLLALVGVYFIYKTDKKENLKDETVYSDQALGFEFTYKTGPDGYILNESPLSQNGEENLKSLILTQTKDKETPLNSEGPATINVRVFKNLKSRHPSVWAMENVKDSNFNLKLTEPEEAVIGGANAVRYIADGLYASENVIVAHGGLIYMFSGMYIDQNSQIRKDFLSLISSVNFIPTSSSPVSGKLNINVVCESALSYMTFPDGTSADAFVAECKEGKHPDVIERYKKDMNLGDGAQI